MLFIDKLKQNIVKTIYYLNNTNINKYIKELENCSRLDIKGLRRYKDDKFKELVGFILKMQPELSCISSSTDLNRISGLKEIVDLPIVTKQFYRDHIDFLTLKDQKISFRSTSGSTGMPFVFPKDSCAAGYMDAMMHISYSWHGIQIGDKQARLWGRSINRKQKIIQNIKDILLRRKRLSVFEFNDASCYKYYHELIKFQPKYYYGYSNALYHFAITLENLKLNGKFINAKIAICTGEVLFDFQRKKIEEILGCKVVNEYGSTENGIIAIECEKGNMHVVPTIYVETINQDESGYGEILITELNSRSLPFVRYINGDVGRIVDTVCTCNRPFEVIEIKEGRIDDYIRCKGDKLVYDAILAYTLKDYAIQFRAIQERIDLLKIYLIPGEAYNPIIQKKILSTLLSHLGNDMNIEIIIVDNIEISKSGKNKYFISMLDNK